LGGLAGVLLVAALSNAGEPSAFPVTLSREFQLQLRRIVKGFATSSIVDSHDHDARSYHFTGGDRSIFIFVLLRVVAHHAQDARREWDTCAWIMSRQPSRIDCILVACSTLARHGMLMQSTTAVDRNYSSRYSREQHEGCTLSQSLVPAQAPNEYRNIREAQRM
jgi:hypothetical protein